MRPISLSDSGVAHDNMNVLVTGSQVMVVRAFPLARFTEEREVRAPLAKVDAPKRRMLKS